jgi:GTPase SAR1 family protein
MSTMEELEQLHSIATRNGMPDLAQRAAELAERIRYDKLHLLVLGEFNRGKTSLVNCLIGEALLPMDIVPTTAAIWTIEEGDARTAHVVAGRSEPRPISSDPSALARFSADGELASSDVRFLEMTVPELAIGNKVVLVDTPGVNDINQQRAEITYGFLGAADAALFLLDAASPVTRSEAEFLKGQVLSTDLDRILFVLNKSSRLDEDELEESLEVAAERLQEILGVPPRIVPFDAKASLDALSTRRMDLAEQWGYGRLQGAIIELLSQAIDREAQRDAGERKARILRGKLQDSLVARREAALLDVKERAVRQRALEEQAHELDQRFGRLLGHVASQGKQRLHMMIRQSFRHGSDEFVQAQRVRISTAGDGIKAYAEKVLPHELQVFTKRWYEGHMPAVQRFLGDLTQHVAREYQTHFGKVLTTPIERLDSAPAATSRVELDLEDKSVNEYLILGLPAAGALGATFLGLGPFAVVGLAAGLMAGKYVKGRASSSLQQSIAAQLPELVDAATKPTLQRLHESVDEWFARFAQVLTEQYRRDFDNRRLQLTETPPDTAAQIERDLALIQQLSEGK